MDPVHITQFAHRETVQFSILAKTAGGAAISNPATALVQMVIAAAGDGTAIVTASTATGEIVLGDEATARFDVTMSPAFLTLLAAQTAYHYNIWLTQGGVPRRVAYGTFILKRSIAP